MQESTTEELEARQCLRCYRYPEKSIVTNYAFQTLVCYPDCGNVFWTLKKCIKCEAENETRFIQKPKTGELVTCSKCNFKVYYFRCPYENCKCLIYRNYNKYIMGMAIKCDNCNQDFKLAVCPCGGQVFRESSETFVEGMTLFPCKECKKNFTYTICPECNTPDYHKEKLQVGSRFKCSHCFKMRVYVPCPTCGRSLPADKFYFGQPNKCAYCQVVFQLSNCPIGCGTNFYYQNNMSSPLRKCSGSCGFQFLAVTCRKCFEPLYMDQYIQGVAREEECPSCHNEVQFYYCNCGMLTLDKKCVNSSCPVPDKCISYSKEWKEEQRKKKEGEKKNLNEDYEEKTCKVCESANSCMQNIECRHIMMCENCYNEYKNRELGTNGRYKCPVCRKMGAYQKYLEPIFS